eukprot:3603786-Ditylum_brightwellii.AAC.1
MAGKSRRKNKPCIFEQDEIPEFASMTMEQWEPQIDAVILMYPMKSQSDFQDTLHWFCKQVGATVDLVIGAHESQTNNNVCRFCNQVGTTLIILERSTPWANRAELYIGLLKEAVCYNIQQSSSPMTLWCYCIKRRARIHNLIPHPLFRAQ